MSVNFLKVFLAAGAVFLASFSEAQDIHFSQYGASPMALNPSLAGMNSCDYRVYANFRAQWLTLGNGGTYRTYAGGADMSLGKISRYNSFAGLGVSFFSDQAGDLKLGTNRVDVSFAYHFMLNRQATMQLSAGLQGAFNYRSIDPSKAIFDDQYDPSTGGTNPSIPGETLGRTRVMFGDAGFGLLYSAMFKRNINFYFGFAASHLNQPRISFFPSGQDAGKSGNERLLMKLAWHGGMSIPMGKKLSFMPNFLVLWQGPSYEFNVGCNFKTIIGNPTLSKTAVVFGVQYRGLFDAVIVNTRVDYKGFGLGLSYDVNISKLMPASKSIGAPEISLIYQGCYRQKPKPGHCPYFI